MSLYAYAAGLLLSLAILAGTHWKAYVAGQSEVRTEWLAAQVKFQSDARQKESALSAQINEARNAATKRETILRRDASAARSAADGLRDELANIRRGLPGDTADSLRQRADTLADVLGACAAEYRSMAESADRIASDRQTLIGAWPIGH